MITPDALALAQAAYGHRVWADTMLDPERVGVLADALEEAGAHGAILAHLRGPGPHARGCWAIDAITGRS